MRITLEGGPANGMEIEWRGDDLIRMVRPPAVSIIQLPPDAPPAADLEGDAIYRRSLTRPDVFIFQGFPA